MPTEEVAQSTIDALRRDIQKEAFRKMVGWAVAGGAGFVTLAALGAWSLMKPTITSQLGVVSKAEIEVIVGKKISHFVSSVDLAEATNAFPTEERVLQLIQQNNVRNGDVTVERVNELVGSALTPYQPFKEMKGAVIAFDRSEDRGGAVAGGACPIGWTLFRQAGGRVIIGAGAHDNTDKTGQPLSDYRAFSDDEDDATGGEEIHKLTNEEMPKHSHFEFTNQSSAGRDGDVVSYGMFRTPDTKGIHAGFAGRENNGGFAPAVEKDRGSNIAHNNMQPYIALYYCKKES